MLRRQRRHHGLELLVVRQRILRRPSEAIDRISRTDDEVVIDDAELEGGSLRLRGFLANEHELPHREDLSGAASDATRPR